jgi:hypothetical protein
MAALGLAARPAAAPPRACPPGNPLPQIAPKAKRAIYISLIGAPSQLDLFDYKPDLKKRFKEDLNGLARNRASASPA